MRVTAASCLVLMIGVGCTAVDPPLSGEPPTYTHVSPNVRENILKTAQKLFKAATGCSRVTQSDVSVRNIRMMFSTMILNGKTLHHLTSGGFLLDYQEIPPLGYVHENDEIWQIAGCKTHREFAVKIFGDDKGSTYFGVFDREKNPPPEEWYPDFR
jgi:hypothetical protein